MKVRRLIIVLSTRAFVQESKGNYFPLRRDFFYSTGQHFPVANQSAVVKPTCGQHVHDEILRFRIDAAVALLARGECTVTEVTRRCGFTTVQYLLAVFKRKLGRTPREHQDRVGRDAAVRPGTAAEAATEAATADLALQA